MLSFMKDGQSDSNPENVPNPASNENAENSADTGDQGFLKTAEHGRNLKQSTITLAILFTVGALCLWFMIKKVSPQNADAAVSPEETKIEEVLMKLKATQLEMHDTINDVSQFYEGSDPEQIDVVDLIKNPFQLDSGIAGFESIDDVSRRDDMMRRSRGLQLGSIIYSPQGGCCMINEKILYEGDTIDGFTVTKIDPRIVVLESDGIPVILKMAE